MKIFNHKFINILLFSCLAIIIFSLFYGCSAAQSNIVYEYVDKPMPIKCVKSIPPKPEYSDDVWTYLKNTLIYKEQLEIIVKNCSEVE